ncbi:glycoside hydrolase family protein [Mucilaginibacter daejeonensis]|uniref:glycoside hydrolase family protein n=1 Tax=Mucilaginibacter daejeonensis TaxID=398049 RepID=UPI001D17C104|nr:glycoside hydrolase family protein [Mucilaginibacter daejeonensis]UEG54167.1 glycoside hydrolase family protein [Mucilaginibacter daejeonensis]
MNRRDAIFTSGLALTALALMPETIFAADGKVSAFAKKLKPIGRRLEMDGYYVWCNSPIEGPDGKIHMFFSRWVASKKMGGWINGSEICHAVADHPEAEFVFKDVILAPRGPGYWDATTCHNPSIKMMDGKYCLFFMGNSNGKTNTKRIGLATATSLDGPWTRPDAPLLEAGPTGAWDDHCTTNPAFIKHPNGEYWLFYKSWNTAEYENSKDPVVKGNRKYGLAIAKTLEGPYVKYEGNPVIDFSSRLNNAQLEDAFVWMDKGHLHMLCRDMGIFNHEYGLLMDSKNGIKWDEPQIAYYDAAHYNIVQPPPPSYLKKYGRFERPQLLFQNGKPTYLYTASQGGKYMTSSSFLFKIS